MIASSSIGGSIGRAVDYITSEDAGRPDHINEEEDRKRGLSGKRISKVQTCNVLHEENLSEVVREMRVTARQRQRLEKEAYHVSLSYHPDEEIRPDEMISDMEEFLDRRELGEHQAVLAVHEDRGHAHVHAVVNRAHPSGEKNWSTSYEQVRNMGVLRELEEERGRISPGDHKRDPDAPRLPSWKQKKFKAQILEKGREEAEVPFALLVRKEAGHLFAEAESWEELHKGLAEQGLQVKRKGGGGIVWS